MEKRQWGVFLEVRLRPNGLRERAETANGRRGGGLHGRPGDCGILGVLFGVRTGFQDEQDWGKWPGHACSLFGYVTLGPRVIRNE